MWWTLLQLFWPMLLLRGLPWAVRSGRAWWAARSAPRPPPPPLSAAARLAERAVLVRALAAFASPLSHTDRRVGHGPAPHQLLVAGYVLLLLAQSARVEESVYAALGTRPGATQYELKRRLADALGRTGLVVSDKVTLPSPWRERAELVQRFAEAPTVRAVYDAYGPTVARCTHCVEPSDYDLLAAVDVAAALVVFLAVSGLATSVAGAVPLRWYPVAAALGWTAVETLGWAPRPLAWVAAWTPYEQTLHWRHLLLAVLAAAPLVLRDPDWLTTDERLVRLVQTTTATVERNSALLASRRQHNAETNGPATAAALAPLARAAAS
jgi:hypothetical protein